MHAEAFYTPLQMFVLQPEPSNLGSQVINLQFHLEEYGACLYQPPLLPALACALCFVLFCQSPPAQRGFLSAAPIHHITT